jgi:hypothetical protein
MSGVKTPTGIWLRGNQAAQIRHQSEISFPATTTGNGPSPRPHQSPAIVLATEQPTHRLSRNRLHRHRHMRVQIQRDADLAVAKQVTHDLGMHTLTQ